MSPSHSSQHGHGGMGARGVSRPMAEQEAMQGNGHDGEHEHENHGEHGHGEHAMSRDERLAMLEMHHRHTLWVYWTLIMLAFWLMAAPFSFGYLNESVWVNPSGGRGAWFSTEPHTQLRAWLMTASDIISGALLLMLAGRALRANRPVSLWACCFVGVWLTMAPILFWAPTAAAYLNDTLVGAWLIGLTILIPGMPNMVMYMQMGPPTPPGWSYNPSSWPQRWIMIATGFAGWLVSRYVAMFQLGYIDYVYDPFFGFAGGTKEVLNSKMSHRWPISDGGLGGISYTFEFLMGFMGSPARWRTMPWMVAFFGVLVIPLGLTHIVLVISQPVIVHHWCSMCLLAAGIMLPMIPLEVDEVVAMCQHVVRAKRRGDRGGSLWLIFWKGGSAEDCTPDKRSPELVEMPERPWGVFLSMIWGMSFPWTLTLSALLGAAVMFLPTLLGIDIRTTAADIGHLAGALVLTVSVIAMAEVVRLGRWLNVPLGLALAVGPWMADPSAVAYAAACTIAGLLIIALAIPRGPVRETYGTWDRWVR